MTGLVQNDGFYDAARARQIALGQASGTNTILAEINALQTGVNSAAASGDLEYVATGSTTMTASTVHYEAWNDPLNNVTSADKLHRQEMDSVINYFSRLGYKVVRARVGVTNFFEWRISW